ncbi:protein-L-isoaspartate O-methyltransferase [Frigidibacter sp. RF13]|uniref:protein-L-isoaspartate O-methyltransferase family protein n=1 Tax=Frigidibacter sp. RF13 TaxID=2997340 RepID=UPI002271EF3E|nr:protein-L-isoaspartate O-methyltransferase [Frigidibacter sp. RF13]MCY1128222.1 protein-L-isoaspartate O-methyltransferase [Frigidibacter sp. RF13]
MTDYAAARTMMVDTQVRPNDVTKFPIIEAMLSVPREAFVPEAAKGAAYLGDNIALHPGRVMLEPRTLAKMLDALDVGPGDKVLIVGAGLGYSAALLARMAGVVVALEADADLAAAARERLEALGAANVTVRDGALSDGAKADGPFDRILVEGAIEALPEALAAQLSEGGRIGAIFMDGALGTARIGHRIDGAISWRFAFNGAAPVLPGFAAKREFSL